MAAPNVVHSDAAAAAAEAIAGDEAVESGLLADILSEIFSSYINMALVLVIGVLLYKILRGRGDESRQASAPAAPQLPKLRRDFTIQELKPFDGTQADGRVLMAVNGTVYDVTKGKGFYGPGACGCCCCCLAAIRSIFDRGGDRCISVWNLCVCVCVACPLDFGAQAASR